MLKLSASVWRRISWNLTKFQLNQLIQTIYFHFLYLLSDRVEILWKLWKFFFKQKLKILAFYLDKQTSFIPKKYIKCTRPCTMDSSFFSQQMAPWRPNFPNPRLWTHYWHSFRCRQLGFVSTFTGYSTSSLVSVVLWSFLFSGSKYT